MPWKVDENGMLQAAENGNPVWVTETGEEKAFDYPATMKRLSEVNGESRERKEKIREMEAKFKNFADIEDLAAWKEEADKAIEMMRNAPDKDKDIEEQVKLRLEAMTEPLKKQIAAKDKALAERDRNLADIRRKFHAEKVTNDVQGSRLLNERIKPEDRTLIKRELMRAGAVNDEGKVIYLNEDGDTIDGEGGNPATVDEALLKILEGMGIDPATKLMSQSNSSGSGATPGGRGGSFSRAPKSLAECKTQEEQIAYLQNPANLIKR